jgi:hypothetical protein
MAQVQSKLPDLDENHFLRNQKTAWLQYLDKLAAWLWQDNEGTARWTLILDDALRHAAVNHPLTTVAGLRNQVLHRHSSTRSVDFSASACHSAGTGGLPLTSFQWLPCSPVSPSKAVWSSGLTVMLVSCTHSSRYRRRSEKVVHGIYPLLVGLGANPPTLVSP